MIIAVIPAFNEENKINAVLTKFPKEVVNEVVVINDGSTDNTAKVAMLLGAKVINHPVRRGVGAAIRTGIEYALVQHCEIMVILAGNDKDDPRQIPFLIQPIINEGADYVQGSRYLEGGKFDSTPLFRIFATRLYAVLWRILTQFPFTDVTNGFRAYKLHLFKDHRINLRQEWLDTYELEYYLQYKVVKLGYKIKEVPVTKIYPQNRGKYSKIRPFLDWWRIIKPLFYLILNIRS